MKITECKPLSGKMTVGPAWRKDHREPSSPFGMRLPAPVCGHAILLLYVGTINCQVEALSCLYCSANLKNKQPNADGPWWSSNNRTPWVPTPWNMTDHILSSLTGLLETKLWLCHFPAGSSNPRLVLETTLQDVEKEGVTKTFQKYCPAEDRPSTGQDFCASIKKCPLH